MGTFPQIDPVFLHIGPLAIRWYAVMYILGFIAAYFWLRYSSSGKRLPLGKSQKDSLLLYGMAGVILGGRIGYVLFYNLPVFLANPLMLFEVWKGGMSFHGGLLGTTLALLLFSIKNRIPLLQVTDTVAGIVPVGLFLGRIGNFINGELYGRVASSFCLYFPSDPQNCRYPSQLLEALLEGLVLFLILFFIGKSTQRQGIISGAFLVFYGLFRISVEFFREPDAQIGYLWGGATEGQILSSLMFLAGILLMVFVARRKAQST